ncbi:MAG: hypothetical protein GY795_31390 [Desulfobacterales bacterium]|nr:hypothetical protein [Desulfobacterales bacterium]
MKFWQKPAGFSAKISFRHSGSANCFWNKMKDAVLTITIGFPTITGSRKWKRAETMMHLSKHSTTLTAGP